ncbi:Calcium-transporting ATPase 3 [Fusarium oxysporum f. sp. albedinis]|nr:Calcium-transporting ATPase 3 [Fusarium oxysporum f. sp. albedinis]
MGEAKFWLCIRWGYALGGPGWYRTRLKLRFENLLAVLQASRTNDDDLRGVSTTDVGYVFSRGEVLNAATHRILALEKENDKLSSRVKQLTYGVVVG